MSKQLKMYSLLLHVLFLGLLPGMIWGSSVKCSEIYQEEALHFSLQ